ncbi:hypothetical protein HK097_003722 [Rhizophlyctis rosea]|uniref:Hypervirulence associated protein TUDOR domain-containing protein n=1 Tax=Rhizophlyctis rosea TaxID=64517 RepID=A0AAD5X9Y2_9FUNG|nr:hypothetical protein HK097_003722 [Rhizophlyctis rosea]
MSDTSGNEIHKGDKVAWNWGRGHAEGVVAEIHDEKVDKTIKGKHITRDGTEENPALFIKREGRGSGNPVLKKASEVHVLGDDEDISTSQKVETQRQHEKEGL